MSSPAPIGSSPIGPSAIRPFCLPGRVRDLLCRRRCVGRRDAPVRSPLRRRRCWRARTGMSTWTATRPASARLISPIPSVSDCAGSRRHSWIWAPRRLCAPGLGPTATCSSRVAPAPRTPMRSRPVPSTSPIRKRPFRRPIRLGGRYATLPFPWCRASRVTSSASRPAAVCDSPSSGPASISPWSMSGAPKGSYSERAFIVSLGISVRP